MICHSCSFDILLEINNILIYIYNFLSFQKKRRKNYLVFSFKLEDEVWCVLIYMCVCVLSGTARWHFLLLVNLLVFSFPTSEV